MEKFNNLSEISDNINRYFNKLFFSNSLKPLEYFEEAFNKDILFFDREENYLFLYIDKEDYFLLYYFINKETNPRLPQLSKPLILELPYRENKPSNSHIKKLGDIGFKVGLGRLNYKINLDNINMKNNNFLVPAEKEDFCFIKENISASFHPYFGCIPEDNILEEKIDSHHILMLYHDSKRVGFVEYTLLGKSVEVDHFLVISGFRNMGLGKMLLEGFINSIKSLNIKNLSIWVNDDNEHAQKLYASMGLVVNNIKSIIMIKE